MDSVRDRGAVSCYCKNVKALIKMIDFRSREIPTIISRTCMFGNYRLESRSPVYIGDVLRRVVGRAHVRVHHVVYTHVRRCEFCPIFQDNFEWGLPGIDTALGTSSWVYKCRLGLI